jgi:hypothetical protein
MEIGGTRKRKASLTRQGKVQVRCLSAVRQIEDMAVKYPEFAATRHGNQATWEGRFKPLPTCATYLLRIVALSGRRPWVEVLEPKLRIPPGQRLETHCFSGGDLCLHLHSEWTPDLYIADTIVPWAAFWLSFYEYWLATGEWHGGGQHPPA